MAEKAAVELGVEQEVAKARVHEEWESTYMTLFMRDQENIEQGIELGKLDIIFQYTQKGRISIAEAAEDAHMSIDEFQKAMEEAGYCIPVNDYPKNII